MRTIFGCDIIDWLNWVIYFYVFHRDQHEDVEPSDIQVSFIIYVHS